MQTAEPKRQAVYVPDPNQTVTPAPTAPVETPVRTDPIEAAKPSVLPNDAKISIKTENGKQVFRGRAGRDVSASLLAASMRGQCAAVGQVFDTITLTPQSDGTNLVFATCT